MLGENEKAFEDYEKAIELLSKDYTLKSNIEEKTKKENKNKKERKRKQTKEEQTEKQCKKCGEKLPLDYVFCNPCAQPFLAVDFQGFRCRRRTGLFQKAAIPAGQAHRPVGCV